MIDKSFLRLVNAIKTKWPEHVDRVSFPLKTATQEQIDRLKDKLPIINNQLCEFLKLLNGDGVERLLLPFRFIGVEEIASEKDVLASLMQECLESFPDSPLNDGTNEFCKDDGKVDWIPFADLWGGAESLVLDMSPGPLGTIGNNRPGHGCF